MRRPVTNARFRRFVEETRYVTVAEIVPDPDDYPGALPEMLYAGSLVFVQAGRPGRSPQRRQLVALDEGGRLEAAPGARQLHRGQG